MLFAEAGLSTGAISSLFVLWSLTMVVLEIPTGALADVVSRRVLLAASAVLCATAFGTWTVGSGYAAFALGFVLWGAGSALESGAYEAYVYDHLDRRGASHRYARIVGLARATSFGAVVVAAALATPLMAMGGYVLTGAVSVAACAAQAAVVVTLPRDVRAVEDRRDANASSLGRWLRPLREGIAEAIGSRPVRHAVVLAAVLPSFQVFDEYFPLLATELGVAVVVVPLLIAAATLAETAGAAMGGQRADRSTRRSLGGIVATAAILLAAGAITGHASGFVAIGLGYGLLQFAIVVVETRLQHQISGRSRATVTSVAGLLSEVLGIGMYATFAGASAQQLTVASLTVALAVALLATAGLVARWLPLYVRERATIVDPARPGTHVASGGGSDRGDQQRIGDHEEL